MSGPQPKTARAVTTIHLKPGVEAEFDAAVRTMLPLLQAQGVRLVQAWTPIIGQYGKVVGIWEAANHGDFISAFADPQVAECGERLEALGPEERRGVILEGSYLTLVGDRTRVLDVFRAPDATRVYAATTDPYWAEQAVDLDWPGTLVGEHIEVSMELRFD